MPLCRNQSIGISISFTGRAGSEQLGMRTIMILPEVIVCLIEPDPYFEDIWKMTYEFEDNFYVEFYAESERGPTVSALVKDL